MHTHRRHESTVPSPLGRRQSTTFTPSTDHLDHILQSVRQQIESWGRDAKWKIDLLLTEPSQQTPVLPPKEASSSLSSNSNIINSSDHSLAVSAHTRYPWDYVSPYYDKRNRKSNDEQEKKLQKILEQNQYLEEVVRIQADRLCQLPILPLDINNVVETMKQVYIMSENEQRLRYITETKMLHKDIQTLTNRLQKMAQKLYTMEDDNLIQDRNRLRQKLYLLQLRLEARDAELEYLRLKQPPKKNASPRFKDAAHKNQVHLLQQKYSPKSRSKNTATSGLDSLGMLADQMLSDPDFDSQHASDTERSYPTSRQKRPLFSPKDDEQDTMITYYQRPLNHFKNEKRSKRSIDSANTLLSIFPQDTHSAGANQNKSTVYVRWTKEEDDLLRRSVETNGTGNWDKVAHYVPDRSSQQCRQRWSKYLDPQRMMMTTTTTTTATATKNDPRYSPSIASLLNQDDTPYHPPSPASTPKR